MTRARKDWPRVGDAVRLKSGHAGTVAATFYENGQAGMRVDLAEAGGHWVSVDEIVERCPGCGWLLKLKQHEVSGKWVQDYWECEGCAEPYRLKIQIGGEPIMPVVGPMLFEVPAVGEPLPGQPRAWKIFSTKIPRK